MGGPGPFLEARYKTMEEKQRFVDDLWRLLPPLDTVTYQDVEPLVHHPVDTPQPPVAVHLEMLRLDKESSSYGHPEAKTCEEIAEDAFLFFLVFLFGKKLIKKLHRKY